MQIRNRRLGRDDFNQSTLKVAKALIGKFIVRQQGRDVLCAMITEAEAYKGPRDRAAHTYGGRRSARVEPLYGEGGTVYVYLIYGVHWMLNFSTAGAGLPEGVLIRGILANCAGTPKYLAGPGRVTKCLAIDKTLDRADITSSQHIWIEDRGVPNGAALGLREAAFPLRLIQFEMRISEHGREFGQAGSVNRYVHSPVLHGCLERSDRWILKHQPVYPHVGVEHQSHPISSRTTALSIPWGAAKSW